MVGKPKHTIMIGLIFRSGFLTQKVVATIQNSAMQTGKRNSSLLNREKLLPQALRNQKKHYRHTHLVREDHPVFSTRRVSSVYGILSSSSSATSSSSTFKNSEKGKKTNMSDRGTTGQ